MFNKKGILFLALLCLAACTQMEPPANPPASPRVPQGEQTMQQKTKAVEFHCKDNKTVSLVYTTDSSRNKKANQRPINLSFNNTTQRLVPIVSESGQKYTNIHWHWIELSDYARLTTALGVILAEHCVKQAG